MRIRPASWLVATALWAGVAMSTANQIIQFQDGDFQFNNTSPNLAIISVESLSGLESKTFVWTSKKQQVSEINLYIFSKIYATATNNATSDAATGGDSSAVTTTATSVTVPSGGPKPVDSRRRRQQSEFPNTLKMTMNATDSMGVVSVDAQGLIRLASTILNSEMYFEAVWADNQGSSYSRIFTVSKDAGDSKVFEGLIQEYSNSSPAKNETGVTSSGTATATGTQIPTATGGSSESASTGGLSTGAIAGIAVACGLVGLALVGALLWFFCRKRRQDGIAPYGEVRNRTQELMAEKEANAGADVSPHSPYSDDGLSRGLHHPSDGLMAGGVAGAAGGAAAAAEYPHHQQPIGGLDRSYTPYSDQPVGSVGSPGTQRASLVPQQAESTVQQDESDSHHGPGGNRSATSASQYAHLVEDGMTADDIRRIEEEERQLDAAIERAGGRRGP